MAKVLANRIKPILSTIISEEQSAFVAGRSIIDNVIVAFEVIHGMKRKTRGNNGDVAFKIDISKAYDRIRWSYLHYVMVQIGFDIKWVRWIMMCVSTVSYNVALNGIEFGIINPKRGLRQGDPLSPYLFILCAEVLVSLLKNAEARGLLHGCKVSLGAPTISHLLFADDSFFSSRLI